MASAPPVVEVPSASTFSFKAPFPASSSSSSSSSIKQRRVSLALPSSPRLVPAWSFRDDTGLESHVAESGCGLMPEKRGKMRKIEVSNDKDVEEECGGVGVGVGEKKLRKKWTMEETQMLVTGCNRHGVGNWKTILSDTTLKFDNRSPVDLKDRFRTYFPDAYKQHYPNAKTHLSSKVRSTLPDGSSLFEKTRSKKRRPFTDEEDRALKAGYEKYGTLWATIVKDPVFQDQNRRSTDLRDRFRNAFPDLYQAAGYKPRGAPKKKKISISEGATIPPRAATDDQIAVAGPVRRRRRHTSQGLLRGGTKSVPQSTTCSEDEESSGGEDDSEPIFAHNHTPVLVDNVSTSTPEKGTKSSPEFDMGSTDPLSIPDFMPSSDMDAQSQTWSSGLDTPTHSTHAWSTTAGSPTSSHLSSDYLIGQSSPFHRRSDGMGMIGKSAWGTQDWFSANPRLDPGSSSSSSTSPYADALSPSSPFSFQNLNHGVLDRYDLLATSFPHDFASEVGVGDSHSTFSDEMFPPNGFRGFTHHSNYAGDLIFGARSHQSQPSYYGPGFGFGATAGLGLSGIPQSTGIHPMQLHTPALPGIDEIELTGITLTDRPDTSHDSAMEDTPESNPTVSQKDESETPMVLEGLEDLVDLCNELNSTPPATPITRVRPLRKVSNFDHYPSSHGRSVSVPPSEARAGLPSRPVQSHANSQPDLSGTRSLPMFSSLTQMHRSDPPPSSFSLDQLGSASTATLPHSTWRSQAQDDLYDLPFLDLHYYGNSANSMNSNMGTSLEDLNLSKSDSQSYRQGQALDLAQSAASSLKALGLPPSLGQHIPALSQRIGSTSSVATPTRPHHARGQSAVVSPQDLLAPKGSDNKRKRASWDGGVF